MLALTLAVGCDVRRGDEPEQPPPEIIAKGQNPEFREVVIDDPIERDRLCRLAGVDANDQWNAHRIVACVDLAGKVTYLPPNANLKVLRHERGHEWRFVHDRTGHGFYPEGNVYAQQGATAAPFDWRNVFAQPRSQTGTTANIFRGQ